MPIQVHVWSVGEGNGEFHEPRDLAIDNAGNILVADYDNNRIQIFTSTGVFISKFGKSGTGIGQLSGPSGIGVDHRNGNIVVAEHFAHRVQIFTLMANRFVSLVLKPPPW